MGRSTIVCDFCKRRKIRCNRERPCSSCIRYRADCTYPKSSFPAESSELKLARSLSVRLSNIEHKVFDDTSPSDEQPESEESPSAEIWQGLNMHGLVDANAEEDDKFILFDIAIKSSGGRFHTPLSYEALMTRDDDIRQIWDELMEDGQFKWFYYNRIPMSLDLNISYFSGIGGTDETLLLRKISGKLPRYQEIWKLVGSFFNRIYPFVSFIDEFEFREKIGQILGQNPDDITIRDNKSMIYLGQLLIIMRYSYINDQTMPFVDHSVVDLAVDCINHYDVIRFNDISYLQLLTLVRSYQFNAPEYGEALDSSGNNTMLTLIIQKAYALGLHREPWDGSGSDDRQNNIRRKLWFHMLINDFLATVLIGGAPNITKYEYTTKVPFSNGSNCNLADVDLDSLSVSAFAIFGTTAKFVTEYLRILLNPHTPFSIPRMKETIAAAVDNYFGANDSFSHFLSRVDDTEHYFGKSYRIKFFFQNCSFLLRTYFHFLHHYHNLHNVPKTRKTLKEVIHTIYVDLLPVLQVLITGVLTTNNEKVCMSFLYPPIQTVVSNIIIIHFSVLSKTTGEFHELLKKGYELFKSYLMILSSKCFYSWRMLKLHGFVYDRLMCKNVEKTAFNFPEVHDIVSSALGTLELNHFLKDISIHVDDDLWSHVTTLKKFSFK